MMSQIASLLLYIACRKNRCLVTWRKCIFSRKVVRDDFLVFRMCDFLQIQTDDVILTQPEVGGNGLTDKQHSPTFVQDYEETIQGLIERGGGEEGREREREREGEREGR